MNELEYIRSLTALHQGQPQSNILLGIGDDCAVIKKNGTQVSLLSMDSMVEGVHFDRRFHPPKLLGRKVVSVNVSDIAAMGGTPKCVLLSAGLPPGFEPDWMLAFNQGVHEACQTYHCSLIGGDTVASPGGFVFTITILGEMEEHTVLYRSDAQAGDTIFVSGQLGLAAAGLALLNADIAVDDPQFAAFIARHLDPEARIQLGQHLAASGLIHAMIDSSDGLATDLAHICTASELGAQIFAESIMPSDALRQAARLSGVDPLDWALRGGEDFELIFTAPPQAEAGLHQLARNCDLQIQAIGVMDREKGLRLVQQEAGRSHETVLAYQGYDHFRCQEKD